MPSAKEKPVVTFLGCDMDLRVYVHLEDLIALIHRVNAGNSAEANQQRLYGHLKTAAEFLAERHNLNPDLVDYCTEYGVTFAEACLTFKNL